MRDEAGVWQALLRRKGLSMAELAAQLGITRQHAHRVLTGRRRPEAQLESLERALALGAATDGQPLFAIAELDDDGELELVPAGDTQPLFRDRALATEVASQLDTASNGVCVVPVWPDYAWRNLVAFHAAWGVEAEPRKLFAVDDPDVPAPLPAVVEEIRSGLAATLRLRAQARDDERLREVRQRFDPVH